MTQLELREVLDAGFGPLSLTFDVGLCAMLGDSLDSLGRLLEIAAGMRRARRGRALLDGRDVFESRDGRQKILSLLPTEALLPMPRINDSLQLAARLRGASIDAGRLLENSGLARFASSCPEQLAPRELRAVALVLSLALGPAEVVLLHDPFSLHALVPKELVIAHCRALSARTCVVVTTTRLEDAIALGGAICRLERGRLLPHVGVARGDVQSSGLIVRSPEAQRLSASLESQAAVSRVVFDEPRSARELLVFGVALPALARCVCDVARTARIELEAMTPLVPPSAGGRA